AQRRQRRSDICMRGRLPRITAAQPLGQKCTAEGITGAGSIHGIDADRWRNEPTAFRRRDHRAFPAQCQRDDARPEVEVETANLVRSLQSRQHAGIIKAWPYDVGERHCSMNDLARPIERPKSETKVGIVADDISVMSPAPNGSETAIGAGLRDSL